MMRLIIAAIATFILFAKPQKAESVVINGNSYFEVCLTGYNECTVGTFTKYGHFVVLIREGKRLPGILLGDVIKPGPYGDYVALLREASYQNLVKNGLERMYVDRNNLPAELAKTQREIDYNGLKCVAGVTVGCGGGFLFALGTGGWGITLAAYTCWTSYTTCEDLDEANKDMFEKRKQLEEKAREEKEKDNAEKEAASGGGAAEGGESGGKPSDGRPGGKIPEVPPRGTVTITEGPGAGRPGSGGGSGHKPIIVN